MPEVNKPDFTYVWSSGGAIVAPSSVKIQTGWTAEVPPFQWENWSQNRQDNAILHLFQKGISVWSATEQYYKQNGGVRAYVQGSNGKIYVAEADSLNQDPTTDLTNTYWKIAFVSTTGVSRFTSNGTFVVPASITTIYVSGCAGGGGGGGSGDNNIGNGPTGSCGGGGGAGQSVIRLPVTVTPGASLAVVIGAAGSAGAGAAQGLNNALPGGSAGTTSLGGSLVSLNGGTGGGAGEAANASGRNGPSGGAGFPQGGAGADGAAASSGNGWTGTGGAGGSSPFGGGGSGGRSGFNIASATSGISGFGFGAGGGGGGVVYSTGGNGRNGGSGTPGILIIEW